jgi:hypothetical protein
MNSVSAHRRRPSSAAVVAAVLLWPVALFAQTPPLAEVAKKEQERKKTVKPATKVLTNKDLPTVTAPPPPAAAPAAAEPKAANEQKPAEPEKDKKEERDETWWRARITAARNTLSRDEMFLEALQSRINALSADFVNRDDPYQRARIGEDRQKALAEMDRVKANITLHKKEIEDIEEEARKASVPPGWLR